MNDFPNASEGADRRCEGRIACAKWDLVGNQAPTSAQKTSDAPEAMGRVRLVDEKPAHVCEVERARRTAAHS
jgi:hypothetical protein